MRKMINYIALLPVFAVALSGISCKGTDKAPAQSTPKSYNLNKPIKYDMPDDLTEVSGIAFHNGKSDVLYAEQDEEGYLFHLKLGDKTAGSTYFGKEGDYEDVAICHEQVVMLRSDGTLFTFAFSQAGLKDAAGVQKLKGLLPTGEYEGLYADEKSGLLYILCKHCADDKTSKSSSGYILQLQPDGTIKQSGAFSVNVKDIEKLSGEKKVSFHPSALTKDPVTGEWYILSSVNKMLVIADANWAIKSVYHLSASIFPQPEGITFDDQRNLYISNEGDKISAGNVLKFPYIKAGN